MSKGKKVAVITGASKGIGAASAQRFISEGYRVINVSRSACAVKDVQNLAIDLLDTEWETQCTAMLKDAIGTPDTVVLIHNAAVLKKDAVGNISAESLREVLELNVVAAATLNRLLLPLMNAGSAILYVSSTLGTKAVAGTYSYVVSKHAVVGQMRASCQDLAGTGVHTACICPGFTDTEMLRSHLGEDAAVYESIAAGTTMGRLIEPGEIAEALWFCSQNPVINGSIMHANLGQVEH